MTKADKRLAELAGTIAEGKLFFASFRYIGFNAWIQLHSLPENSVHLWDVVLFDLMGERQDEIVHPDELITITGLQTRKNVLFDRDCLTIQMKTSSRTLELRCYFKTMVVHDKILRGAGPASEAPGPTRG